MDKKQPIDYGQEIGISISIATPLKCKVVWSVGPRPEYPQTTVDKVASVFELDFVCLFVCLIVCQQILSPGVTSERRLSGP